MVHKEYPESDLVKYGFAQCEAALAGNTPSDQQKLKAGADVAADGNIPLDYQTCDGDQADKATVQENMTRLAALLKKYGQPLHEVLVVDDRAMLDDRLALLYDEKGLRYTTPGTVSGRSEKSPSPTPGLDQRGHFTPLPLDNQRGRYGHWGRPVAIFFEHEGQAATHQGLVVLSGPMRFARPAAEANSSELCGKPSRRSKPGSMPVRSTIAPPPKSRPGPRPSATVRP